MTLTGDEWLTLALRVALMGLLYGAIALVLRISLAELTALAGITASSGGGHQLLLVAVEGAAVPVGKNWPLQTVTSIGRTTGNVVAIEDPYLSAEHAEIVHEAGAWWVRDKGSTNGTRLNGVPVAGRTAIHPGDVVHFGAIRLQVQVGTNARG